jgi:hypothetical protein
MKRGLLLLVLAACTPKSAPPDAGADAGTKTVKAPKPKPHVETSIADKGSAEAPFHVHSRFPADSEVEVFPLDDGIAVVQWANSRSWKLSTAGTGKPPRALTGRITRDEDRGELAVRGTTSLVFVLQRLDGVLHRVTPGETKRLPNRFTHVVELRRGQWVGLEVVAPEESVNWDFAHGEYKVVGGKGLSENRADGGPGPGTDATLPLVPSHLRPRRTVQLADGKICADATKGNSSEGGIWTADVGGHQYLAPFTALDVLFRGADGECYVLDRDYVSSDLYRVKGDDTQLVAEIDFHKLGYDGNTPLQTDREGGMWFIGAGFTPRRIVATDGVVTTTKYPIPEKLPEKLPDCAHPTAMRIVALDATDVWILAACRDEQWHFSDFRPRYLLHTGPAETPYDWPAP